MSQPNIKLQSCNRKKILNLPGLPRTNHLESPNQVHKAQLSWVPGYKCLAASRGTSERCRMRYSSRLVGGELNLSPGNKGYGMYVVTVSLCSHLIFATCSILYFENAQEWSSTISRASDACNSPVYTSKWTVHHPCHHGHHLCHRGATGSHNHHCCFPGKPVRKAQSWARG